MSAAKKGVSMETVRSVIEDVERRTGKRLTGYRADYGDAKPEDVAWAMLMKNWARPVKKKVTEVEHIETTSRG